MKRPKLEEFKREIYDGQDYADWYEEYFKALEEYADYLEEKAGQVDTIVSVLRSSRDAMLQVSASHPHLSFVKQINEIDRALEKVK